MTFSEQRFGRPTDPPEAPAENRQDIVPPTERGEDPERSLTDLVNESARPLSNEERKAADRDNAHAGERVYAPASERVPKTIPDYNDVVTHPDAATPERQAVAQANGASDSSFPSGSSFPGSASGTGSASGSSFPGASGPAGQSGSHWPVAEEPSFTRAPRPGDSSETTGTTGGEFSNYDSQGGHADSWDTQSNGWMSNLPGAGMLPFGMGWLGFGLCAGVGVWLWMRWQRERNKPINRLRRQARQAASMARERMPEMPDLPDEATRPAIGLGTALLSIAVLLWQQSQARSREPLDEARGRSKDARGRAEKMSKKMSKQAGKRGREAVETVAEIDWQDRLMQLRRLWNPSRIELEKVSIPKR